MTTETSPILNLLLAKGVGVKTLARIVDDLIASHLSPDESSINELAAHLHWSDGFTEKTVCVQEHADKLAEELEKAEVKILVRGFPPYPEKLTWTLGRNAPPVLFAKGNLEILEQKAVGFCGSRKASDKGVRVASDSARQLGQKKIDVVSGYAKGVDLAAHCAGLEAGGTTTIVLAEGILHFRPKREIKKLLTPDNYVVVSEFSPRIPWAARNAMQRNETIIGLSDAMIVIESGTSGGTHACAESALRLGHPLFVAEYSSPADSAEGNRVFLGKGAHALRGDRRGQPNLSHVYESLGIAPRGKDPAEELPPVAAASHTDGPDPMQIPETAVKNHEEPVQVNRYPKRLIEVDLPIARISAHARAEKDSRLGHIPRLHIYPAARPVAACRAVICAALWPDPADELCPPAFRDAAATQLMAFANRMFPKKINEEGHQLQSTASPESRGRWEGLLQSAMDVLPLDPIDPAHQLVLRGALLDFIADFASWDNSTVPAYLETSRALTQAAHEALGGVPGTRPLVVDPFAGGGAIPLEACRIGGDAFASDLSPVSFLINRVLLEYVPKLGHTLVDAVAKWGAWAQERAKSELSPFYPVDPDGATPIAYLFARTIKCEGPSCGIEVPLIRSLWLSKKGILVAAQLLYNDDLKRIDISICHDVASRAVGDGTVRRGSATCPACGFTTPAGNVREQLKLRKGGASDARLYCVVTTHPERTGRSYRPPSKADIEAIELARRELQKRREKCPNDFPLESTPQGGGRGAGRAFSQKNYGMDEFADLFNDRQLLALSTYAGLARQYSNLFQDEDPSLAEAVNACLALAVNRLADLNASLCGWQLSTPNTAHVFVRWALQLIWDYGEVNPLAGAGGSPESVLRRMTASLTHLGLGQLNVAHVQMSSAQEHPLPDDSAQAFITDPPYYDAVPYADLMDYFYVWMKRSLRGRPSLLPEFDLTPKEPECIVDDAKGKSPEYFESTITKCFDEGRRVLAPHGIGVIVFAHKSTSSWERLIQAIVDAGWTITSSWPIDTEMGSRMRARQSAALASSVHLVCRPRESISGKRLEETGEWRDVLSELPKRIHEWMPRLAAEGVVGADAIFACLGPALEIFSRYSRVEKADGSPVPLKDYLEEVWSAVSTEALSMIFKDADAAGLEPDARLTAMWLWTIGGGTGKAGANGNAIEVVPGMASDDGSDDEETSSGKSTASGGFTLEFDAARKIAQGLGVHLEQSDSIVEVKGDKARLLPVGERIRHLFGKDETTTTTRGKKKAKAKQRSLFEELDALEAEAEETVAGELKPHAGETVLDRVHQSMILFASGRGEALRRFLVDDGAGKDARFWKLAQSLSALYPPGTDEKRWVDGVLARKKGLGL